MIVDGIIAGNKVDVIGNSKAAFGIIEELGKGLIGLTILSKVKSAHSTPVFVSSFVTVGEEVEEGGCLSESEITFRYAEKAIF